jgi:hypothetical protein
MAASVKLEGLEAFRQALRSLPEDLAREAGEIVESAAEQAKADVQRAYPEGPTGNLRRGVTRQREHHSRYGAAVTVRSRAQHSHIYEKGTQARSTRRGANRGRMPAAPQERQMIPIVIRHRKRMTERLKDLVRKAGFQVD